jgi:hypothetical protein
MNIWNVLTEGGILVSAFNRACLLDFESAQTIFEKFDVFITDDVYSCVQYGYVAPTWNRSLTVHPFYFCLRFFAKHREDERLRDVLTQEEFHELEVIEGEIKQEEEIFEGENRPLDEQLFSFRGKTWDFVGRAQTIIRKLAENWTINYLLDKLKNPDTTNTLLHLTDPQKLMEYTSGRNCYYGFKDIWKPYKFSYAASNECPGVYAIFRKKVTH